MTMDPEILHELEQLQNQSLSILKLSEPITASASTSSSNRRSDASSTSLDAPTPSSLEADLAHYRELFSKLRFSYVEQVTKEKFIRAIVGDPPLIVTPLENVELEKENLAAKGALKALKLEVAALVADLEERARDLSRRTAQVQIDTAKLKDLPQEIALVEESLKSLRHEREEMAKQANGNIELALPLGRTLELVEERKAQMGPLDRELEQLRARVPRKKKELERLKAEIAPLDAKKTTSTAAAREARRRKEAALGGVEDDLEERGRWYRASEAILARVLEGEADTRQA
ncbi:Kinetochore protein Sos7 [Ceratocystis fimbriata CBS 114723]|uniref:Kinetochore protein Sos7 n=1 Tax=Ceratocystis fimbriata CBS 114723 TaxID=1035309 RepID=A0A2C5WYA8_9PEZI|nr:Kinetochore protein Sos7 [Ceratocystis fimbriata CBS 114723]